MAKTAIIIGAGPAGVTAAYELLTKTDIKPIILEASSYIGGISRSARFNGNIIDLGGHRFFSKDKVINDIWQKFMPFQGQPTLEEKMVGRSTKLTIGGPDPEKIDNVFLMRSRVSHIYYLDKFFDYPLSMKWRTFKNLGFNKTIKAGFSYIKSRFIKKEENNLENFYINHFGSFLYKSFFKDYTTKVWGRNPSEIDASWGKQRVKGLSLTKAIGSVFKKKQNEEASLIKSFAYPKYGVGSMYEAIAKWCVNNGAILHQNACVTGITIEENKITSIEINHKEELKADYIISSMPLKDLINAIKGNIPSKEIYDIANHLPYRDFIGVGLLMKDLKIHNESKIKTINNRIRDTWIYVQQGNVQLGRIQVLNNWSPYLVKDNENTTLIGLEYFANEGDKLWEMSDKAIIDLAINEACTIGLIDKNQVIDSTINRVLKAYPAYFDSYKDIDKLVNYLNSIDNLYCIGRNGQHRYNNMDHSMLTAIKCVEAIKGDIKKEDIWKVNTKSEYHE